MDLIDWKTCQPMLNKRHARTIIQIESEAKLRAKWKTVNPEPVSPAPDRDKVITSSLNPNFYLHPPASLASLSTFINPSRAGSVPFDNAVFTEETTSAKMNG